MIIRKISGFALVYLLTTSFLTTVFITLNHSTYSRRIKRYTSTEEFYRPYKDLKNSSKLALKDIERWFQNLNYSGEYRLFNDIKEVQKSFNRNIKTVCISILTKERFGGWDTLIESVASLLTRIDFDLQDRVLIYLFDFSDSNRDELIPIKRILKEIKLNFSTSQFISENHKPKVKEAFHYSQVLSYFSNEHDSMCKYIAVIEDDAIASTDWFPKIISSIEQLEIEYPNKWLLLKLFTSLRPFDWLMHTPTVFYFVLSIFITSLIQHILTKKILNYFQFYNLMRYNKTIFILIFLNTAFIQTLLNTINILPLGLGVKKFSQGFNTVSNLYPMDKAGLIADYLSNMLDEFNTGASEFYPKDIAMKQLSIKTKLSEFIVEPSIFQHIGLYSSLGTKNELTLNEINKFYKRPFKSYSFDYIYAKNVKF